MSIKEKYITEDNNAGCSSKGEGTLQVLRWDGMTDTQRIAALRDEVRDLRRGITRAGKQLETLHSASRTHQHGPQGTPLFAAETLAAKHDEYSVGYPYDPLA
jgi:hypothetical protein